jgi:hypothetical protein
VGAIVSNDYYVYAHRKATTGEVFYVGKGYGNRAGSKRYRNQHWQNVVKKHGFTVEILESGLQEWAAFEIEIAFIALFGRMDLGNGKLVNQSDGGEGASGAIRSLDTRKKLQVPKSESHKAALSAAKKGLPRSKLQRRYHISISKPVLCIEINAVFRTVRDAASWLTDNGFPKAQKLAVYEVCVGKRKTAYKHTWRYA